MKLTKRKAFNFLRSYFDVLNELDNDSDKLDFLMSIINKQFLDEDPEGLSFISNLCYQSQRHQIESSVKGYKSKSNDAMQGGTQGGRQAPYLQEEEEEKEKEKEKEEEKEKFSFRKTLLELTSNKILVDDWLKVRKTKKATNTETALNSFIREVKKTNESIDTILEICIEHSWKGFKVEWLNNINSTNDNKNGKQITNDEINKQLEQERETIRAKYRD
jgi:hypothetical protein